MSQILHELDAQWSHVVAAPESRRALIRWKNDHPVFAGIDDLDGVVRSRHDRTAAREVQLTLARLAPDDELAARTLLQILLPGLVRLAASVGPGDPTVPGELVSHAWDRIRSYPESRLGSVAANVIFDVRKAFSKDRYGKRHLPLNVIGEPRAESSSPEDVVIDRLFVETIASAPRRGLMTEEVLHSILRTRVAGETPDAVATDQQISARLLVLRRWRAERRLRCLPLAG